MKRIIVFILFFLFCVSQFIFADGEQSVSWNIPLELVSLIVGIISLFAGGINEWKYKGGFWTTLVIGIFFVSMGMIRSIPRKDIQDIVFRFIGIIFVIVGVIFGRKFENKKFSKSFWMLFGAGQTLLLLSLVSMIGGI